MRRSGGERRFDDRANLISKASRTRSRSKKNVKTKYPAGPTLHRLQFVSIICAFWLASSTSRAAQALAFQGGFLETIPGYEVGWSFHVATPITIDSLGWFDAGSNGLAQSHNVNLWSGVGFTGTFVTTVAVNSTHPVTASGYRFAPITPLTLGLGDYSISGNSGNDSFQDFGASITTIPEIFYLGGRYSETPATFPFRAADRGLSYVGPNFTAIAAVPEPTSWALILGGTVISALFHRRQRNG